MQKDRLLKEDTNHVKYKLSIIVSVMIFIIVLSSIIILNYFQKEDAFSADKGILDLTNYDIDMSNVKLSGEWEFYPCQLINPGEVSNDFDIYKENRKYIEVPSSWEDYLNNDSSAEGSGTYRLIIRVSGDGNYGIKTRTIRSASRIFINGSEVAHMGKPALNKNSFKPNSKYTIGFGESIDKELEIVIQVSSYAYRSGGIVRPIEFGNLQGIMDQNNKDRALDAFIISINLTLSLYFFFIFLTRRREIHSFYFSSITFLMAIYLSTMNEQLLDLLFNYSFMTRTRIQIYLMVAITLCFLRFTHYFFRDYGNRKVTKTISNILIIMHLLVLNNPEKQKFLSIPYGITQLMVILCLIITYGYIFWILLKSVYYKTESLVYILPITTSMFCYWFIISLKIFLELDLRYIPVFLILNIMILMAFLVGHRLQLDYLRANTLSEQLIMYDRIKDDFVKKAFRELLNPLYLINNLSMSLLEGRKGSFNKQQQKDLYMIQQKGKSLVAIVDDLLDLSKIEKGEANLSLEAIDSFQVVDNLLKEMRMLISVDKTILLYNKIPEDFPTLKGDLDRFKQIIYNLLHNSIKNTEKGSITVDAKVKSGQAEISVIDTGRGIEKKDLKEIFNIFYKKDKDSTVGQGLGLGLPIAKYLVECHSGKIEVESRYEEGSTFKFTFPLCEEGVEKQEVAPSKDMKRETRKELSPSVKNPIILILSDRFSNIKTLWDILYEMECSLILAYSEEETLEILKKNKIDLVILDFVLLDIPGDEICRKIRQEYSMAELPILLLTEVGRAEDFIESYKCEINAFEKKPINPDQLQATVQSLLLMKASVEEGLKKEFQYFYSQISPHFLYNTLNTIIGLSYKDTEKVREALYNLSIYFRGKLDLHQKSLIPLDTELEIVRAYLGIEKARYGDRLKIIYDIDEGLKAMIPPLTLQPLIENSVRHGIGVKDRGGTIKIAIKRELDDKIGVSIEDDGLGMAIEKQKELLDGGSQRMGFSNVLNRIKILKGATLLLESGLGQGTRIKIIIPEVKQNESNPS